MTTESGLLPTADFLDDFSTRWLTAWNSHSTDRVLALLHSEIVWDDHVFWPEVIHGIAGVELYVEKIWEAMPDVAFDEIERFRSDRGRLRGGAYLLSLRGRS